MKGENRREKILEILKNSEEPVSGSALSKEFDVSRQVIVQDIALLRANGNDILSEIRGYILNREKEVSRIFKVIHTDEEVEKELSTIVDLGGKIKDVFVFHRVYGIVRGDMNIRSRNDIKNFIEGLTTGKSSLLKNITSGYHYHTVTAEDSRTLDIINDALKDKGLLAELQDYEPNGIKID